MLPVAERAHVANATTYYVSNRTAVPAARPSFSRMGAGRVICCYGRSSATGMTADRAASGVIVASAPSVSVAA